jgi:hypothetical protein
MTGRGGDKGADTPPKEFAQVNPPASFDQLAIMQSLIEIHKDLSALGTKTERVITDLHDLSVSVKSDVKDVGTSVQSIVVDAAKLSTRVDHLPSKEFIVVAVLGVLALFGGMIAFQDQIRGLFHPLPAAAITRDAPGSSSPP